MEFKVALHLDIVHQLRANVMRNLNLQELLHLLDDEMKIKMDS